VTSRWAGHDEQTSVPTMAISGSQTTREGGGQGRASIRQQGGTVAGWQGLHDLSCLIKDINCSFIIIIIAYKLLVSTREPVSLNLRIRV
jgi:hypothetical protein